MAKNKNAKNTVVVVDADVLIAKNQQAQHIKNKKSYKKLYIVCFSILGCCVFVMIAVLAIVATSPPEKTPSQTSMYTAIVKNAKLVGKLQSVQYLKDTDTDELLINLNETDTTGGTANAVTNATPKWLKIHIQNAMQADCYNVMQDVWNNASPTPQTVIVEFRGTMGSALGDYANCTMDANKASTFLAYTHVSNGADVAGWKPYQAWQTLYTSTWTHQFLR